VFFDKLFGQALDLFFNGVEVFNFLGLIFILILTSNSSIWLLVVRKLSQFEDKRTFGHTSLTFRQWDS
jgi:hypothetical protein